MAIATCETLGQGLTRWLEESNQTDVDALCAALKDKCGDGDTFVVGDGVTITVTGDGSEQTPYVIAVKVDPDAGNALTTGPSGLKVGNAQLELDDTTGDVTFTDNQGASSVVFNINDLLDEVAHEDTDSVALSGEGNADSPLSADVRIDPADNNATVITSDGLFTQNAVLDWDQEDSTLTFSDNKGGEKTVDLSQFLVDIHISSADFDPLTTILTLHSNDPDNPEITVNLGDLAKSTTENTTTVDIEGDGSVDNPLSANVNISDDEDNRITIETDGLKVGPELPPTPTADGSYALVADVSDGEPTYRWEVLGC